MPHGPRAQGRVLVVERDLLQQLAPAPRVGEGLRVGFKADKAQARVRVRAQRAQASGPAARERLEAAAPKARRLGLGRLAGQTREAVADALISERPGQPHELAHQLEGALEGALGVEPGAPAQQLLAHLQRLPPATARVARQRPEQLPAHLACEREQRLVELSVDVKARREGAVPQIDRRPGGRRGAGVIAAVRAHAQRGGARRRAPDLEPRGSPAALLEAQLELDAITDPGEDARAALLEPERAPELRAQPVALRAPAPPAPPLPPDPHQEEGRARGPDEQRLHSYISAWVQVTIPRPSTGVSAPISSTTESSPRPWASALSVSAPWTCSPSRPVSCWAAARASAASPEEARAPA